MFPERTASISFMKLLEEIEQINESYNLEETMPKPYCVAQEEWSYVPRFVRPCAP